MLDELYAIILLCWMSYLLVGLILHIIMAMLKKLNCIFFSYLLTVLLLLYSIAYSVMGLHKESKLLFWLPLDILKTVFLDGLKRAGSQNE